MIATTQARPSTDRGIAGRMAADVAANRIHA